MLPSQVRCVVCNLLLGHCYGIFIKALWRFGLHTHCVNSLERQTHTHHHHHYYLQTWDIGHWRVPFLGIQFTYPSTKTWDWHDMGQDRERADWRLIIVVAYLTTTPHLPQDIFSVYMCLMTPSAAVALFLLLSHAPYLIYMAFCYHRHLTPPPCPVPIQLSPHHHLHAIPVHTSLSASLPAKHCTWDRIDTPTTISCVACVCWHMCGMSWHETQAGLPPSAW